MRLARPHRAPQATSLVSLIDIFMILLVFFVITSSFLDLDRISLSEPRDDRVTTTSEGAGQSTILRISPRGAFTMSGRRLETAALAEALAALPKDDAATRLMIFPSPAAPLQALVDVLDAAILAGIADVRLLRVEEGG